MKNPPDLSQHDKELIEKARRAHFTEQYIIDECMLRAQSERAKETIRRIGIRLYRQEEYLAGLL